jgi:hypothetical protein
MNQIVLVGFTLPSLSPLVNLPNLFADDFDLMLHELLKVQLPICFFVVNQLCLLAGLCGSLEVSVLLVDTCHWLC